MLHVPLRPISATDEGPLTGLLEARIDAYRLAGFDPSRTQKIVGVAAVAATDEVDFTALYEAIEGLADRDDLDELLQPLAWHSHLLRGHGWHDRRTDEPGLATSWHSSQGTYIDKLGFSLRADARKLERLWTGGCALDARTSWEESELGRTLVTADKREMIHLGSHCLFASFHRLITADVLGAGGLLGARLTTVQYGG